MDQYKVSFSIVVYEQSLGDIRKVVNSLLLYGGEKKIFIIDNSPACELSTLSREFGCVEYEFLGKNVGFGAAHNLAFKKAKEWGSKYHVIVNPDISYSEDVVQPMVDYLDNHPSVGQLMPRILYPNGNMQYLPKLTPEPQLHLWRKLPFPKAVHRSKMERFEMRPMKNDKIYDVANVTGCFSIVRTDIIAKLGGYDERFFMYFEDADLSRRIHTICRTQYFPMVSVYHDYGRSAQKKLRLFLVFVDSFIKYFNKWGWVRDPYRRKANRKVLEQIDL